MTRGELLLLNSGFQFLEEYSNTLLYACKENSNYNYGSELYFEKEGTGCYIQTEVNTGQPCLYEMDTYIDLLLLNAIGLRMKELRGEYDE